MKRFTLLVSVISALSMAPASKAMADSPAASEAANDSTAKTKDLQEVVVEADRQMIDAQKSVYYPASNVKKASRDATDLLARMAIPQLNVSPLDKSVKTNTNQSVSIFINYMAATQEDILGLRTTDVLKVEYLDYPADPRFRGADHAVNIIVREYEYGGYTKITDTQFFVDGCSNQASIFSKFAYKKMTYDLFLMSDYVNTSHVGSSSYSAFRLPAGTVRRDQLWDGSDFSYINLPVTLRATYNSKNVQISNSVGLTFFDRYKSESTGRLVVTPSDGSDYSYRIYAPALTRSLSWNGSYYFMLPNDWSIGAYPNFSYSHNNTYSRYTSTLPGMSTIDNDAREDAYNMRLNLNAIKKINNNHTIKGIFNIGDNLNNVHYIGDNPFDTDFNMLFLSGALGYSFSTEKWQIQADAGYSGEFSGTNDYRYNDSYPYMHLNAAFSPNRKNRISLWMQYATGSPGAEERSPNVIQSNELLYQTGNPDLLNMRHVTLTLNYTLLASNTFQMNAWVGYFGEYNILVRRYSLYNDGKALLASYENDGDFTRLKAGTNLSLRLLGNSLVFGVRPELIHYSRTGLDSQSLTDFNFLIYGYYYINNFYFSAGYYSRQRSFDFTSGVESTSRSRYQLETGWANNDWNISVSANNFARWHRNGDGWAEMTSAYYDRYAVNYNGNCHASFMVSATYTFGYGKKIERGNEIGAQGGAGSAVMH